MTLYTNDFKTTSYWQDITPLRDLSQNKLPKTADVVIIGAGYTGVSAALFAARDGRNTVMIDAGDAGGGCSTQNGGHVSTSIKPTFEELSAKHGATKAFEILKEGPSSVDWLEDIVKQEQIDCDFKRCGRFSAAHNTAAYNDLAKKIKIQIKGLETGAYLVPKSEQHTELASDIYHGGAVFPNGASVDPAKLHRGLLDLAIKAGANVVSHCPALSIEKNGDGIIVNTPHGTIKARDVIVATNGYTDKSTPWHRRRIIPIGSYIIATEPLTPGMMDKLIPNDRMIGDTRKLVYYYRSSPDRQRIVFGGRVSHNETDALISAPKLRQSMVKIFPELTDTKISHSWTGFVGFTFDTLAHTGKQDGVHYAMGYCGSGVAMATYLGMRTAQKVLGQKEGKTGFDDISFQTRPFYTGDPWFLGASVMYYKWRDSLNI